MRQGADLYRRASCHPMVKKHVTPVVELIFNRCPFSLVFPCGWFLNPFCLLELPIYIPFCSCCLFADCFLGPWLDLFCCNLAFWSCPFCFLFGAINGVLFLALEIILSCNGWMLIIPSIIFVIMAVF